MVKMHQILGRDIYLRCYKYNFAKGSHEESRLQSYSMWLHTSSACSLPKVFATTSTAMSIPADTPEEVTNLPSQTQRA